MEQPKHNGFTPLIPPQERRPKSQYRGPATDLNMLRDNFTISTWLSIGAALQALLVLTVGRLAIIPVFIYLIYHTTHTLLVTFNILPNPHMRGVIQSKVSAQFPSPTGVYGPPAASSGVVVFLIGARNNHPLGILAPGFKEFGTYFPNLVKELEASGDKFGFLGMTSWLNTTSRTAQSEILYVGYFKTVEGLHAYAHSPLHREAWSWFDRNTKRYPHLGIFHETYNVPEGQWEAIAKNMHVSGVFSATQKVVDAQGKETWASPVVEVRGALRSMKGRMGKSAGDENEKYEQYV